jgi:phenylacetate-CoA ligase
VSQLLRMLHLIRHYRRTAGLSLEALEALQRQRLGALIGHAQARSAFHRARLAGVDPAAVELSRLPTMGKPELMERFDEVVCDPRLDLAGIKRFMEDPGHMGQRYRGHVLLRSSGTSGRPVVVAYGAEAFDHVRAVNLARGSMVDASGLRVLQRAFNPRPLRVACVLVDGGFVPSYANFLHQPAASRWFIDVERISLRLPIERVVARLNDSQPSILFAYPSVLELLAQEALAGRLHILAMPRARVVSLSEPLTPRVRALIGRAFGAAVFDIYGAAECLPIGRSCEHDCGLHVNIDMVALEVVDQQGRPVPDGVYGSKVLITNLFNPVLPLIRYELRDVVAITREPCGCGSRLPRLLSVRGRSDELIRLEHPDGGERALHPTVVIDALVGFEAVMDWQLVQTARDRLRLNLVLPGGQASDTAAPAAAIQAELDRLLSPGAALVEPRRVERISAHSGSGKVRRIVPLERPG